MTNLIETLSAQLVRRLYNDCLADNCDAAVFNDEEDDTVIGDVHFIRGINGESHFFSKNKLIDHNVEIEDALLQLPDSFMDSINENGESFLQSCFDKNGNQWGELHDADLLISMGRALELADYCVDRAYWNYLPGYTPIIVIYDGEEEEADTSAEVPDYVRTITDKNDAIGSMALTGSSKTFSIFIVCAFIALIASSFPQIRLAAFIFYIIISLTTIVCQEFKTQAMLFELDGFKDMFGITGTVKGDTIGDPFKDTRSTLGR